MTPIQKQMRAEGWTEKKDGYWIDPEEPQLFATEHDKELSAVIWQVCETDKSDAKPLYSTYAPEYYDETWELGQPPTGKGYPEWRDCW